MEVSALGMRATKKKKKQKKLFNLKSFIENAFSQLLAPEMETEPTWHKRILF